VKNIPSIQEERIERTNDEIKENVTLVLANKSGKGDRSLLLYALLKYACKKAKETAADYPGFFGEKFLDILSLSFHPPRLVAFIDAFYSVD